MHERRLPFLVLLASIMSACARPSGPAAAEAGPSTGTTPTSQGRDTEPGAAAPTVLPAPVSDPPVTPEGHRTSGRPPASSGASAESSASGGSWRPPRGFERIGSECRDGDPTDLVCGPAATVAGVYVRVDETEPAPPPGYLLVHEESHSSRPHDSSLEVALAGDRLWIRRVTCGSCRRILGWAFMADLTALSEGGLRELQARLGMAADAPLLGDGDAWRRHYPATK